MRFWKRLLQYLQSIYWALLGRGIERVYYIEGQSVVDKPRALLTKPRLKMTGWRVWMEDDSEYDSEAHTYEDIPTAGVQAVIVHRDDDTKVFLRGARYYIWLTHTVIATMKDVKTSPSVKEGTRVSDRKFKELMQRTM